MKTLNPILQLAAVTHGGQHFMVNAVTCVDGADLTPVDLVKQVAKILLRRTLAHHGWNAQLNSKAHLRRAAITGRFDDLPDWVKTKMRDLHFRLVNISNPAGLL